MADIKITKDERNERNRNLQVKNKVDNGDAWRQKQSQLEVSGLKILKKYLGTLQCFKGHEMCKIKGQLGKNDDTELRKKFIEGILSFLAFYKDKWNDKQKMKKRNSIN